MIDAAGRRSPSTAAACAAIAVTVVAVYSSAVSADFLRWDDDVYVTRNPLVHDLSAAGLARVFTSISNCNYHPLTYVTWMLEHAAVGLTPWLYHLDNILLHAAAGILVFVLTRRLLASDGAAVVSALLFVAHPIRVESVAWIAERKDVLCAVLYLAALACYVRHLDAGRRGLSSSALALLLLALLAKAMAMTLPAALLLILIYRRRCTRGRLLALAPFAALSAVFAVVAVEAQAADGALKELHGGSPLLHALTIPKALAIYCGKLLWPLPLSPRYTVPPASGIADPLVIAGLVLLASGAVAAIASLSRRRVVFLGVGFFALTWAPVSGVVPTSTIVADRYMYLPALGLVWPLADLAARSIARPERSVARAALAVVLAAVTLWCCLSVRRVHAWQNGLSLWSDALHENPANPYAYNQLAIEHLARGSYREAERCARRSIELGLDEPRFLFNLCLAQRGLGDAKRELETARGIVAGAPDFLPAWGVVLRHWLAAGNQAACERKIAELALRSPRSPIVLAARGDLFLDRGLDSQALDSYTAALREEPQDRETLLSAALALARLGDHGRSRALEARALALRDSALWPEERERLRELRGGERFRRTE